MKNYTAAEAAAKIGAPHETKAELKAFRDFLRKGSTFARPARGKSWNFTTADLPLLKSKYAEFSTTRRTRTVREGSDAIDSRLLKPRSAEDRARVKKISEDRVDRLEAGLKAAGLHISQRVDR